MGPVGTNSVPTLLGCISKQDRNPEAEEQFRRVLMTNPEDAAARYYVNA